ncbi:MAG: SseB family protein [Actinomycetes bacterium]
MSQFEGAQIPDSSFANDDGVADTEIRAALEAFVATHEAPEAQRVINALTGQRLLVPVVAHVDSVDEGVEKDSHMTSVEYINSDGRKALLAFTGVDSLALWDPQARPIPRASHVVAQSVLEADLEALIIDLHGPHTVVIEGPMLVRLAISAHHAEYLDAALEQACDAIEALDGVISADWETAPDEIVIILEIDTPTSSLGPDIAEILQEPNVAVVLDRPLNVEIRRNSA